MNAKELAELWEPLAARAPELRPEGIKYDHDTYNVPRWWFRHSAEDRVCSLGWVDMADAQAAALWRDAAVRWLAGKARHIRIYEPGKLTVTQWVLGVALDDMECVEHGPKSYDGPTLDHALAAAVKAVLDAVPAAQEVS